MAWDIIPILSFLSLLGARADVTNAEIFDFNFVRHVRSLSPRADSGAVALRNTSSSSSSSDHTVVLDGSDSDFEYLTNVTIGGQKFSFSVDTGSSDTWVIQQGFSCFDLDGNPQSEGVCAFGSEGFSPNASKTFTPFPGVSFNITYSDGEALLGPVGMDTVTIGGLSVEKQVVPIPTHAAYLGDGINSGIIGLSFPGGTTVFNTTDPLNASEANQLIYSPFFLSAVEQKKVENPYFSIALDRGSFEQEQNDNFDPNLGFLSFGGIAPVPVLKNSVTVPIQGFSTTTAQTGLPGSNLFFYTVDVESYTFPGSDKVTTVNNNTVLDTGTTVNYFPSPVAAAYAAQFSPPAVEDPNTGLYTVACNAAVPDFAVTIGGKTFPIDKRDQIIPTGKDANNNTVCITGTQDGGADQAGAVFILGDVFLHNVVATFNPVDGEVTLTQRVPYS
ncbi:aspartic peptidase domain-containing protein [Mycena galopus ATCC 62051]|nr:aspartic peptidase domain-containing protein [Mycena galopus ATCC 62051]